MSKVDANTKRWNEKWWLPTGAQFTWGLIGPQNPVPICGLWFNHLAFRNLNPGCLKAQIWNLLHLPQATIFTRHTIEMQVGTLGLTLLTLLPMASGERVMWGMRVIQNNCGNAVTSKSGLRIPPTWFIGLSFFAWKLYVPSQFSACTDVLPCHYALGSCYCKRMVMEHICRAHACNFNSTQVFRNLVTRPTNSAWASKKYSRMKQTYLRSTRK